ncbi:hypothetical protein D3C76_1316400 [compost metagenome]
MPGNCLGSLVSMYRPGLCRLLPSAMSMISSRVRIFRPAKAGRARSGYAALNQLPASRVFSSAMVNALAGLSLRSGNLLATSVVRCRLLSCRANSTPSLLRCRSSSR